MKKIGALAFPGKRPWPRANLIGSGENADYVDPPVQLLVSSRSASPLQQASLRRNPRQEGWAAGGACELAYAGGEIGKRPEKAGSSHIGGRRMRPQTSFASRACDLGLMSGKPHSRAGSTPVSTEVQRAWGQLQEGAARPRRGTRFGEYGRRSLTSRRVTLWKAAGAGELRGNSAERAVIGRGASRHGPRNHAQNAGAAFR